MKNVRILYVIQALHYAWFWLGIWVLYYKGFGGFAAVGILETVMIVSTTVFEVPTGAIGDLLGKRKTLFMGFLIWSIAQFTMGFSQTLLHMVFTLIAMNLGGALISGTFEAMAYDSLKDEHAEKHYSQVISHFTSISLLSMAICGAIGGIMYGIHPSIPFIVTGAAGGIATILTLFLKEPQCDTEKFTIRGYIKQNFSGFIQLVSSKEVAMATLATIFLSSMLLIFHEGVNDMLIVIFEFTEVQMGFISSALALLAAGASFATRKWSKDQLFRTYPFMLAILTLSMLVTPYVGAMAGLITIAIRSILSPVVGNEISVALNEHIDSRYRATALSTFSMLKSIPYVVSIYVIGVIADVYPLTSIVFILGVIMIGVSVFNYQLRFKVHVMREPSV